MKSHIFIISIITILLSSCSRKIELEIPDSEKKVVVFGLIQADSIMTINLSFTKPMLENGEIEKIDDAKIELFENEIFIENLQPIGQGKYQSTITAKSETNYKIIVTVPDFDVIKASTYVPAYEYVDEGTIKPDSYYDQQQSQYESEISITFNDSLGIKNYYQASFYSYSYSAVQWDTITNTFLVTDSTKSYFTSTHFLYSMDPVIVNEGDLQYYQDGSDISSLIFSDKLLSENNTVKFLVQGLYAGRSIPSESLVIFKNISYDFYMYQKSWVRQSFNQGIGNFDATNMFLVNNPNDLYTNIENGLGIFAGYSETQFYLEEINSNK